MGRNLAAGVAEELTSTLTWQDVEPTIRCLCPIWVGRDEGELNWAEQAWGYVVEAGLASYSSELELCRCAMRVLALLGIYEDFNELAWDQPASLEYNSCADALGISDFRLGQLAGADPDWLIEGEGLPYYPLNYLADKSRPEVCTALCDGFGDDLYLYFSLVACRQLESLGEWPQDWPEAARNRGYWEERLRFPRAETEVLGWIMTGCEPYASAGRDP